MTTRANAPAITEETVRQLSQRHNEPEWLLQRRLDAWRAYEAMAMPNPLEEEWRRTDISQLDLQSVLIEPQGPVGEIGLEVFPRGGASSGPQLFYGDLSEGATSHREIVERHLHSLVKAQEWKLQALQAALWQGAIVYVPRGLQVEAPVRHLVLSHESASFPHLLIFAEANSSVTVVQETRPGPGHQGNALVSGAVEIIAGADARVRFVETQRWGNETYAFSTMRAHLERGAELSASLVGLGGALSRTKLEVTLAGEGSRAELIGLAFGNDKQHFDYVTLQDHIAPRTASDLLFKTALDDESSAVWTGTVRIQKGASASEANQTSRNLLLSEHAKAAPIPILEIEAYDVLRCSHGASAGPLDEDQLFYLESRGIPPAEAQTLLVDAFFREVIDRLPEGVDRDSLDQAIAAKIGASRR
ncbi:MAG TPA: Fe-S cluster assembly protein SufD [Dehalococcoidia bacterium]